MTIAVKNNNKAPLVVPRTVRRRAGFRSGQELEFRASGGVITILPKLSSADEEYTPAQRRAIDRRIGRSLKEYREGKGAGPFETAEAFLSDLHAASAKLTAKKSKNARK